MTVPPDRIWTKFAPGAVRESILTALRNGLRRLVDPQTQQPFSEETIRRATIRRSRFYVEANSIDLIGQTVQRRDEFLAQQVDPRRASSGFLQEFHGPAWQIPHLVATGGSGTANVTEAVPGTTYIGSTTVPDPFATSLTDPAGLRYQVFMDGLADADGEAALIIAAIDAGNETNLEAGTILKFDNPPPGSPPTCTVAADFTGGTPEETDQQWGQRIFDSIGERAAAGNSAHLRQWARDSTNSVDDAFVYPCALNAGSVVVAITQKRGSVTGPSARVPSLATLNIVSGFLTPPSSGVFPGRAYVVVVGWTPESTDAILGLGLRKNSASGWADPTPWPAYTSAAAAIIDTPTPTDTTFRMSSDMDLPSSGVPQIMVWREAEAIFEKLFAASITAVGGGLYDVVLAQPSPNGALVAGDYISPLTSRATEITQAINDYFDSLGLGEIVDIATDVRGSRAFRRPRPDQGLTYYAGDPILVFIDDALGGTMFNRTLLSISRTTPTIPTTASEGPNGLVSGKIMINAL